MHRYFLLAAALVLIVGLLPAAPVPPKGKPTAEDIKAAEKAVAEFLAKKMVNQAMPQPVQDEAVERMLPGHVFFTLLFRQFPIGRPTPPGFGVSNVLAVDREGKVTLLKDAPGLEAFFKANLPEVQKDDQARDAVRAFLRLAQEFHQDGFYKFTLMGDSVKAAGDKAKTATGKVVVMQGGNGEINGSLEFDAAGKLVKASETAKLRPGPRPICQATKLLDPDPIVRRMAEQDLRIMGRYAEPYLKEQRAKASPELRQAIDRLWQQIQAEDR
jgi:hypothetical protein